MHASRVQTTDTWLWQTEAMSDHLNTSLLEQPLDVGTLSQLATAESWRKELHSPPSHVQKWWAQRLGVVNRHVLMAAASSSLHEYLHLDRGEDDLSGVVVYDPFSGSGGTLLEAAKLGAEVIGRDVNPVATLATRQALQKWDARELQRGFDSIVASCDTELNELYQDQNGRVIRGFFWVASAACGVCDERVDLFHRHVFARHAYPKKHPVAHGICRMCGDIVKIDLSIDDMIWCASCSVPTPFRGPVSTGSGTRGTQFECSSGHSTRLVSSVKNAPIRFRMYAKLYEEKGRRVYARTDGADDISYSRARTRLDQLGVTIVQPNGLLKRGKNTDQVLRVGFNNWQQFFNDRQRLALGLIATAIRDLEIDGPEREALAAVFSKSVEFNNMLASYKGEGTGAVRSVFHNHTLQFERMPFETNPWSTASGGFHTSYKRLIRALDFKTTPTDLRMFDKKVMRVAGYSKPPLLQIVDSPEFGAGVASVTCGDSGNSRIPDSAVDIILTDPPHFDKVNYSELADFFHAWLRKIKPFVGYPETETTRSEADVQHDSPVVFETGLTRVWKDVARTLKDDGIAVFSFHHRKAEGWRACMNSLRKAGLCVTYLQMVRAEMTSSLSKRNQSSPHSMDVLVICRKAESAVPLASDIRAAVRHATGCLRSLAKGGADPLPSDGRSLILGSVLSLLTNPDIVYDVDHLLDVANRQATRVERLLLNTRNTVVRSA